ncbi:hypothetical protein BDZ91DRAFT_414565 [Kalaharituber pfeilii]|nr:hypothetical protein BDZ91DRAFT_414565 [Kalaharituber pfeilii]
MHYLLQQHGMQEVINLATVRIDWQMPEVTQFQNTMRKRCDARGWIRFDFASLCYSIVVSFFASHNLSAC